MAFAEDRYENILREETLEELAVALEKLPQRERDIIILHYYFGKTFRLKQAGNPPCDCFCKSPAPLKYGMEYSIYMCCDFELIHL